MRFAKTLPLPVLAALGLIPLLGGCSHDHDHDRDRDDRRAYPAGYRYDRDRDWDHDRDRDHDWGSDHNWERDRWRWDR